MSATVFLAICILGCDFLLYFLFQWTYGERRRGLARRSHRLHHGNSQQSQPFEFVHARRRAVPVKFPTASRFQKIADNVQVRRIEREAYQRIAATFAAARR